MIVIISPSLSAVDWQLAWRSWEFFEHTQKWRSASARKGTRRRRVKFGRCCDTAGRIKQNVSEDMYLTLCKFCSQTQTWSSLHVSSALFSHSCVMWISLKYVLVFEPRPYFHTAVSCGFHLNIFWFSFENMKIFILWILKFWRWCKLKLQLLGYDTAWFSYRCFGETCCITSSVCIYLCRLNILF